MKKMKKKKKRMRRRIRRSAQRKNRKNNSMQKKEKEEEERKKKKKEKKNPFHRKADGGRHIDDAVRNLPCAHEEVQGEGTLAQLEGRTRRCRGGRIPKPEIYTSFPSVILGENNIVIQHAEAWNRKCEEFDVK
jgi:hypothetical protein